MPIDYADYHPDWKSISRQIREQAGNVCEFCGAPNGETVQRNAAGDWKLLDDLDTMQSDAGWAWLGTYDPSDPVRVVLTVAHLDHDTANNDPANLRALCQRCHLNWDRERNIAKAKVTAAATRGRKRWERIAATGQRAMELV